MNNQVIAGTPATFSITKIVAVSAALAASNADWPMQGDSAYSVASAQQSYSPLLIETKSTPDYFEDQVAAIFANLSKGQEPLGSDFEKVWDENIDKLYEA